jgi:hypothetical protein
VGADLLAERGGFLVTFTSPPNFKVRQAAMLAEFAAFRGRLCSTGDVLYGAVS